MKKKDFQNLRQQKDEELQKLVIDLRGQVVKLHLNMALRKEKSPSLVEGKKKDIARILTIMQERKLKNASNS